MAGGWWLGTGRVRCAIGGCGRTAGSGAWVWAPATRDAARIPVNTGPPRGVAGVGVGDDVDVGAGRSQRVMVAADEVAREKAAREKAAGRRWAVSVSGTRRCGAVRGGHGRVVGGSEAGQAGPVGRTAVYRCRRWVAVRLHSPFRCWPGRCCDRGGAASPVGFGRLVETGVRRGPVPGGRSPNGRPSRPIFHRRSAVA
ncbi:hypothetical protein FAIPA1_180067 [Frankia sp. AiPs1]